VHQQVGGQQHEAHQHVVDDEVLEIGLPFRAEHRLVLAQGKELLDEDEDQRRAQQVQDEPVQADVGRVVGKVRVHLDLVPTQQRAERDQREGKGREPACAVEQHVHQAQASRHHHRAEQQLAHERHVVLLAQLGCGEVLREMKGHHAQEAQDGQRQGDHAGDQAAAWAQGAVAFGELIEFLEHATPCLKRATGHARAGV